jgi:hypothetical protein
MDGPAIISKLRELIDAFNVIGIEIRDLLLYLARWMDETKHCKQDEICRKIKLKLREQIIKGKITERWIEDCLPKEYKRKYQQSKSELTSPSRSGKLLSVVDTQRGVTHSGNSHQEDTVNDSRTTEDIFNEFAKELENSELHNSKAIENLKEFIIPKEMYENVNAAMLQSKNSIRVAFKNGICQSAIPDTAET